MNFDIFLPLLYDLKKEISKIYEKDFNVETKDDNTPLTQADMVSHNMITKFLNKNFPDTPIISEENKQIENISDNNSFFLIDPLDGTKEFINKNGEFTVNIALIENKKPVFGIIYAPAIDNIYYAKEEEGAFKIKGEEKYKLPHKKNKEQSNTLNIISSRSHKGELLENYIQDLQKNYNIELTSAGSSLKFGLLAEGKADIYPRFTPTMERDIAAGDVIIRETGYHIYDNDTCEIIEYNKKDFLNNYFIAK